MVKKMSYDNTYDKKLIEKWTELVLYWRWFPDLFIDMVTPKTGGIRLDLDQRVFLRALARFYKTYDVFPRGYGKTFIEVLYVFIVCLLYPDSNISLSAQTKESSAGMIKDKIAEIKKYFPMLSSEIIKENYSKDTSEVYFANGSKLDNLANAQSSKGKRRHRLNMEESALINDFIYQDALEPIPNVPRRMLSNGNVNPYELSGQMHFLTTAYFKNTEYDRLMSMLDDMINLKGSFVLGSDWKLACEYGRGETKTQILDKKDKVSPVFFATNYESRWIGNAENCLVDIEKLMKLRVLPKAEIKGDGKSEYYIGVDVARSTKTKNNQTSICIGKVKRDKNDKIKNIQIVNLVNLPNGMNFTGQAIAIKKIRSMFNAVKVVIDSNGLGIGLVDELLKSHIDPMTGEELLAFETTNTDHESDEMETIKCLHCIMAQNINTEIIVNFMGIIESAKLQLLEKIDQNNIDYTNNDFLKNGQLASVQTDFFIEEVSNLQLKTTNGGKLTVERNSNALDKDRYSAIAYMTYYIMTYENKSKKDNEIDLSCLLKMTMQKVK